MAATLPVHRAPVPTRRSPARAAVAAAAVLLLGTLAVPSLLPQASAATGTVKIDNVIPQNNNNPHQGCGILVELYNWTPAGPASVYVVFSGQGGAGAGTITTSTPPSGPGSPITFTAGSGDANTPDGSQSYDVDTAVLTQAPNGTYHVDVDVYDSATGTLLKQKVITVEPCNADLALDKRGPASYSPGSNGVYTIDVTNNGPSKAPAPITVTDTLPVGETATAASGTGWTCVVAAQLVTCTRATDLAAGASAPTITVSVSYTAGATGSLTDTASVSSTRLDLTPGNNSDSVTSTMAAALTTDMGVSKSGPAGPVAPGTNVTYLLTATNAGTASVTSFTLADNLGTGLSPVSITSGSAGLTCTATCTYSGSLAPGGSVTATVVATVGAAFTGTSVTNDAVVSAAGDTNALNDGAAVTTAVAQPSDVALTKTALPASVTPGQSITYTLTARNDGVLPLTAFTLSDPLGAGLTWVSTTTVSPGLTCLASAPVSCSYAGSLAAGQSVVATVVATVPTSFTGTSVTNAALAVLTGDADPADNSAAVTTPVTQPLDVKLVKAAAPALVSPGGQIVFTLTASNDGVLPLTAFTVTDPLVAGLTWVSTSTASPGLTCAAGTPVVCTYAGSLTAGQSVTATVIATVSSAWTAATVPNVATAAAAGDGDASNDSSSTSTPVNLPAPPNPPTPPTPPVLHPDLVMSKTGPATVVAGSSGSWQLVVSNEGDGAASGPLTVTDPVPAGTTATSATGSGWSCTLGATVTCTRAAGLAAGGVADAITVTADFDEVGTVTNTAQVATVSGELDTGDNSDSAATAVTAAPVSDVAIRKEGPTAAVTPGDEITWVITVTSQGTAPANGFTVTDALADGLTLTGAAGDSDDWACVAADTVACSYLADLAPGATATLTVSAVLAADYEGTTVSNTVVVGPTDATPEDNTDTATVTVAEPFTGGGGGVVVSPPEQPVGGGLPTTGTELLTLLGFAAGLLLLGGAMSAAGRRREA